METCLRITFWKKEVIIKKESVNPTVTRENGKRLTVRDNDVRDLYISPRIMRKFLKLLKNFFLSFFA